MRLSRKKHSFRWEEEFPDTDLDIYSDEFDDEEAISSGMKASEAAFIMGFKRH